MKESDTWPTIGDIPIGDGFNKSSTTGIVYMNKPLKITRFNELKEKLESMGIELNWFMMYVGSEYIIDFKSEEDALKFMLVYGDYI